MIMKIWCDMCDSWVDECIVGEKYLYCACGNGLVKLEPDDRIQIAKKIWGM